MSKAEQVLILEPQNELRFRGEFRLQMPFISPLKIQPKPRHLEMF